MDLTTLESLAKKIQVNLFKSSSLLSHGRMKTPFLGAGLQFREHRLYVPGDDVRFLDWKMLAKTQHPYVKTFEEERKIEVVVFLDFTLSMLYGFEGKSKWEVAIEICALLSLLLERTGDIFTLVLFLDKVHLLPGLKGREGIGRILYFLESKNLSPYALLPRDTHLFYHQMPAPSLLTPQERQQEVLRHLNKRKEILILSDFSSFFNLADHLNLNKDVSKIMDRPRVHCFQIASPLDLLKKIPFSLMGFLNSFQRQNQKSVQGHLKAQKMRISPFGELEKRRNFTRLLLGEPFLDHFLRGVVK